MGPVGGHEEPVTASSPRDTEEGRARRKERKELKEGKEGSRSRIPRLVPRPQSPGQPDSQSPSSEEEEARDRALSSESERSRRAVSSASVCSDDTGCPSSQTTSPSKTPSGSEGSSLGSPSPNKRKGKAKRVRVNTMAERNAPSGRLQKEPRSFSDPRGSEAADLSSSSSPGSLRGSLTTSSNGRKVSYSRSRGSHNQGKGGLLVHKTPLGASLARDTERVSPQFRTSPHGRSSNSSSSNSSPTTRRSNMARFSCSDNYGVKAPNPEQYLTPLQQKEVTIRHLKTKLKDSESRVQERELEIEELKAQLERMREDWIEEECHRVEAQLALKEARKEIKQLREVVETMKNSLTEKDKGIQKYFTDINIQNRKLESLLHSMELAQSDCLQDESTLDFVCNSPTRSLAKLEGGLALEDQAAEEMADSGLLINDEMANQTDIFEKVLMSTAIISAKNLRPGSEKPIPFQDERKKTLQPCVGAPLGPRQGNMGEKAVQTDSTSTYDVEDLFCHLLKMHAEGLLPDSVFKGMNTTQLLHLTASDPVTAVPPTPEKSMDSGLCSEPADAPCSEGEPDSTVTPEIGSRDERNPDLICSIPVGLLAKQESGLVLEEQTPGLMAGEQGKPQPLRLVNKHYWSRSFLVDLVALAAPALPTVAWLYATHQRKGAPVYNIGTLIRGCCIVGLHTLRHISLGPNT
ncbi:syntabulin-like [Scleropages formosus]|uniref:Syntabulin n=1 Tax=Scleropages formosus TaxID=113540 RepID=A0A8C9T970_SCLFO|nr:syntabulin [Scleropages formosus]XP_029103900.1 syntabulin [Scleropages formosus]